MTAHKLPSRAVAAEIARKLGDGFRAIQRQDGYWRIQRHTAYGWRSMSREQIAEALAQSDRAN